MVKRKHHDEKKAQVLSSSSTTTGLRAVNPIGHQEHDAPLDLRLDTAFKVILHKIGYTSEMFKQA